MCDRPPASSRARESDFGLAGGAPHFFSGVGRKGFRRLGVMDHEGSPASPPGRSPPAVAHRLARGLAGVRAPVPAAGPYRGVAGLSRGGARSAPSACSAPRRRRRRSRRRPPRARPTPCEPSTIRLASCSSATLRDPLPGRRSLDRRAPGAKAGSLGERGAVGGGLLGRRADLGDLRGVELQPAGGQEPDVERLPHRDDERVASGASRRPASSIASLASSEPS